ATLEIFETEDVLAANRRLAAQISAAAAPLAADPRVAHFRHTGMIWAFDARTDDPLFARRFHQAALDRGLLLRPLGNTVYFMPPYILDGEQIALLIEGTLGALGAVLP
ncbi:MAG: aminotransferase class III-fold pyridoxal phosphate-dependent enzyme, partial [Rhodocyclaceae bacterium]|nr:aminotransferase class III-fold pyridoxal phosphate-dependent enzyme [Rhodocyclaceae bacterium]